MTAFLECGPMSARVGDGRLLFENVSLSLSAVQSVTIEGSSGSGKSSLLRLLTGLAWSPRVRRSLDGHKYRGAELPAWRAKVTLVAQDAPMVPGSVLENLRFPFLQKAGRKLAFAETKATELLASVGLEEVPLDRDVRILSGGERHRLALVRSLLWDPPVLVADESLAGLDPDTAERCFELLLRFGRRPEHLLVCVLHDPALTSRTDRRFRIGDGRLVED